MNQHPLRSKLSCTLVVASILVLSFPRRQVRADAGDIDTSFGTLGVSTASINGRDFLRDLLIRPDGKILAAGFTYPTPILGDPPDFALMQFNSDGTIDTTFGTSGHVTADFSGLSFGNALDLGEAVAVQQDGKIVVAGESTWIGQRDFALVRYTADGRLDESFGNRGKVLTDFAGDADGGGDLVIQPDGKIVVVGYGRTNGFPHVALVRYTGAGLLDTTFGGGKVVLDIGRFSFGSDLALLPNGQILVVGYVSFDTREDFVLARYDADGTLDRSFGSNGIVTTDMFGGNDRARAVIVQPDGRIIVGGNAGSTTGMGLDFGIARYNSDGTLDQSFGIGGKSRTDFFGDQDTIQSLVLQADGRIVAVGTKDFADRALFSQADFAVARYNPDGTLDDNFGVEGKVTFDISGSNDVARAAVLQPDGKLLVAGTVGLEIDRSYDFALARFSTVTPVIEPDFDITLTPATARVVRVQKLPVTITVRRIGGFAGSVTVTAPEANSLGIRLSEDAVRIEGDSAAIKLKIKRGAPPGTHSLVFLARDAGGREHSATLALDIE
ncbi:MAG TPA: delta-60 repeat domain-containing protein [Blastocatellia bacterium]|nr:delta-60 repeat domain-containing protein [Blastocatellia bacterium]